MWGTKSASYNLCVFDLGEQIVNSNECCDEVVKIKTRSEGGDGGKISCVANHGGKNCSNAFGINNGRCTFNPNVCMDYNGWFTDCVNGKVSNFPGSDCDTVSGEMMLLCCSVFNKSIISSPDSGGLFLFFAYPDQSGANSK